MKYDKQKFESEFNRLMNKHNLSYNPETKEWSRKGDSYIFGEEAPDIIINLDDDKYSHLKDYEPGETEQESGDEMTEAWGNFKKKLFICLDIFLEDTEIKFFNAFVNACLAINELWEIEPYDEEIQRSIIRFLQELDMERATKLEKELSFCLYTMTKNWKAKADMLPNLIVSEISWDFPYPGYYEDEAFALIVGLGDLSGEESSRLERDYEFLLDIHHGIKEIRSADN